MSDFERAEAMAAFLAWPAAPHRAPEGGLRHQVRTACLALALGLALSVCSMLAPLSAAAAHGWGTGAHFLLFCHLAI